MNLFDELFRLLRAQRGRAVLTLSSVAWGTVSVVLLLAFGIGFHGHFQKRTRGIGLGMAVAWPSTTTIPHQGFGPGRRIRLTRDDVLAIAHEIPEMLAVSPEFATRRPVARGERVFRVRIAGVEPDYMLLRNMQPTPGGRFLNPTDVAQRRRVVFLGDRIAGNLFDGDPVGQQVELAGTPFTVVGVLAPKDQDSDYGGRDEDLVCMPGPTYMDVFGARFVSNFVFTARSAAQQERCVQRVYEVLGSHHGFSPNDRDAINVWDLTEQQNMIDAIFLAMNIMFALAGGFTLIVAGVGVANLMFLLVRRRTREIGLCMAVGARPRQIQLEVLAQSMVLVGLGGAIGLALSGFVIAGVRRLGLEQQIGTPNVPPTLAIVTVLLLAAIGLVAGWAPAQRAARLDPVEALQS